MTQKVLLLGAAGYIGSRLFEYLRHTEDIDVTGIDLKWFGSTDQSHRIFKCNFKDLEEENSYDTIICLAGHSSVPFCQNDPQGSFKNNVQYFNELLYKLRPHQKLIFASSASLYGNKANWGMSWEKEDLGEGYIVEYDKQKRIIENLAFSLHKNSYALRFGTVCGYSQVPRNELMINSMVRDAKTKGIINVTAAEKHRAILGLNDLCRALGVLIPKRYSDPGIYNLASFNSTIMGLAMNLGTIYDVPVKFNLGASNYSFQLNCDKFKRVFNFEFQDTLESVARECEKNDFTIDRDWSPRPV